MVRRSILILWLVSFTLELAPITTGRAEMPGTSTVEQGEFTAKLNGLQLWYKVSGQGPICIMPSPGWGPSSDLYFRTLKPLEKIFTIVYFDTRGTGRSEHPGSAKEYTWDDLVADLDALREHLKQDRIWMMGHSEGGMQILHYACQHADRVNGLVLLAAKASISPTDEMATAAGAVRRTDEPWFAEAVAAFQAGPGETDEQMAAQQQKLLPLLWADPARIEPHQENFAATSMSIEAWRGTEASRSDPFDLSAKLKQVKSPALIVVGDKDIVAPPLASRQIHLSLPNSKLLLIEDCGHFAWLEQAEEFNSQVPRFLEVLGLQPQ